MQVRVRETHTYYGMLHQTTLFRGARPGRSVASVGGDLGAGFQVSLAKPDLGEFCAPRMERLMTSYGCPASESAFSLLGHGLLAW